MNGTTNQCSSLPLSLSNQFFQKRVRKKPHHQAPTIKLCPFPTWGRIQASLENTWLLWKDRHMHWSLCLTEGIFVVHCFQAFVLGKFIPINMFMLHPGYCGSVDRMPACEARGCWFDSQSGHMPGLQARSPVGGLREATTHCCFSSFLLPSLPPWK